MAKDYEKAFRIDTANSDREHLYIDMPGKCSVVIGNEDDGVVVDIYPLKVADEPVATTWADMSDLWIEEE